MSLVEVLRSIAQTIATLAEGIGVAIVAVAVIVASVRYVIGLVRRVRPFPPEGLRLSLGRSLALSLEFLLGADILRTAVEPSWDEIGRLAGIAAIRTALNYFLQREIAQEARMAEAGGADAMLRDPFSDPVTYPHVDQRETTGGVALKRRSRWGAASRATAASPLLGFAALYRSAPRGPRVTAAASARTSPETQGGR